ncbi:MAG: DUF2461 domain-containing protein [Ginsengibacter sp.]
MLQKPTLTFLKKLEQNNHKTWFDEHRPEYQKAKNDFEILVQEIINGMIDIDLDFKDLTPRQCMFRINRDIRFSKNKTPYKTNIACSLKKGGKKSIYAGYYFHLQPGNRSFTGGGIWMPASPELKKVRQEIDYCFSEFKEIIQAPSFKKTFHSLEREEGQVLVNIPKGYEKDNPAGEFLKLKSFFVTKPIQDSELLKTDLLKQIIHDFKTIMPLNKFINRSFE